MPKVMYYYQTFAPGSLDCILKARPDVTDIHLSSIHFGLDSDGTPYIHLNDHPPDNQIFDYVWSDLQRAHDLGIRICLMIGGAGGAYETLFKYYDECFLLLKETLTRYPVISGINFDIEEPVDPVDVRRFIADIHRDFPAYELSMAPVQYAVETNSPGMGGFIYSDLLETEEGRLIGYLNVQFYSDFSVGALANVISNGYDAKMIVMGCMNGVTADIPKIKAQYPTIGGVCSWEFATTPDPEKWANSMASFLNKEHLA